MTLIVTGKLSGHGLLREQFADLVEASGGELAESFTSRVKLVVVGEKPGKSKLEKAQKSGVPVLTEAEFWAKHSG